VQPWITLFHWDYPLGLYHRGGWLNRDSADWFADYARIIVEALSDRVTHWMTLNEPRCFVLLGHGTGIHAPGLRMSRAEIFRAAHHAFIGHGRAVQTIRAAAKEPPLIGVASAMQVMMPATDDAADLEAARRGTLDATGSEWDNAWWMDPLYLGRYPAETESIPAVGQSPLREGDMAEIAQPLDLCGLNIYFGKYCRAGEGGRVVPVDPPAGYVRTAQDDWAVTPESLYYGPMFMHERTGLPIVITENGHQNLDGVSLDGCVYDPQRIDYLQRYLLQLRRAAEAGVPVKGYFQWTLMDNFEWALGYKVRVGLVHTDYQTLRRTPKDSFYWYRDVAASNGTDL
jgi:beta-glucosidase